MPKMSAIKVEVEPPKSLKSPMEIPQKILMGPGPSNCPPRVLKALSNPILGHLHPETLKIMDEIKEGIQYIFQTRNTATMCISASGHAGIEAALCNLLEDNDIALMGSTGVWAHRAAEMAQRYGAIVRFVEAPAGAALTLEQIQKSIEINKPKVLFIVQGDSATGVLQQNLKEIGLLCRKHDCLLVVDTVASLGGTEFQMDNWNIDVAYTGAQKVLAAPPGITPISFNDRAMQRIRNRKSKVKVYFWDATLVGQYWNCFENQPRIYHHTISATLLYGLREALAIICEMGITSVIQRHIDCSQRLQDGIVSMGLEMFVPMASDRLATVNTVKIPAGLDWKKVSEYAMRKYSVEISGGLGPTADKVFRIGLMGSNASEEKVDLVLEILEEAIQNTSDIMLTSKKSKI